MTSRVSIALLVIALLTLAGLQYNWIGQISVAERERLEASVRESSNRFASDLSGEIRSFVNAFDIRGTREPDASAITYRYRSWMENSQFPGLLKTLYLVRSTPDESAFFRVDVQNEELVPTAWPSDLAGFRSFLRRDPNN